MDAEDIRVSTIFESGGPPAAFEPRQPAPMLDLPFVFAQTNGIIIHQAGKGRLTAILRHGANPAILLEVSQIVTLPIDLAFVSASRFQFDLLAHYGLPNPEGEKPIAAEDDRKQRVNQNAATLIDGVMNDALHQGVSDIHIEAFDKHLIVRFRRDGKLYERLRMSAAYSKPVSTRLREYAKIDCKSLSPKNGVFKFQLNDADLAVSISILPSKYWGKYGERMVLRIPNAASADAPLELLGMAPEIQMRLRQVMIGAGGMIIVAGPKGSGVTATLYAALNMLNDAKRNIMTVEHGMLQSIDGINQMQIKNPTAAAIAEVFASAVLQDPDVVMVSEMPDRKTAEIALQAALTGPLVLTALHADDAIGVIGALRELKVDRMLLGESLRCIIAQRLVKRLCSNCRVPAQAAGSVASRLGFDRGTGIFEPKGCGECDYTGFSGRIGVFEVVCIDDTLRRLIISGGDEAVISSYAFRNNPNLSSAARKLVISGETTAAEAIRIGQRSAV
jgi:general secretion pathway protein E